MTVDQDVDSGQWNLLGSFQFDAGTGGNVTLLRDVDDSGATSADAVARLRKRKHREEKPLAVMARDLDAVREVARLSPAEAALLESPERPIALLEKKCSSVRTGERFAETPVYGPSPLCSGLSFMVTFLEHVSLKSYHSFRIGCTISRVFACTCRRTPCV